MGVLGVLILLLVLLAVGGGGGGAAALAFKDKLPFLPAAAKQADAAPPKTDNTEPPKADDKLDPQTATLLAALSQDNFDKIAKGMSADDLKKLLGPPTLTQDDGLVWRVGGVGPRITATLKDGRVAAKSSGQDWAVKYPAVEAGRVTREDFDKIDKGMTEADLVNLLGPPTYRDDKPGAPSADLALSWGGLAALPDVTVHLRGGRVTEKLDGHAPARTVQYPSDVAQNPPDKPPAGVSQANYDKIDKGMTEKDLTDLLGQPSPKRRSPTRRTVRALPGWTRMSPSVWRCSTARRSPRRTRPAGPTSTRAMWPRTRRPTRAPA